MRTETRGVSLDKPLVTSPSPGEKEMVSHKLPEVPALAARYVVLVLLSFGGLTWDLWSKWWVFDRLNCPGQLPVWNGTILGISIQFDLATTFNRGALWGIGQNQTWFFATLSFVAIAVIVYFVWTRHAIASWWLTIASGLLLAGTMGNLYDRMGLHGWKDANGPVYAVRDFLDFVFNQGAFHWATFNFADTYLVVGAFILAFQSFAPSKENPPGKSIETVPH